MPHGCGPPWDLECLNKKFSPSTTIPCEHADMAGATGRTLKPSVMAGGLDTVQIQPAGA